MMMKYLLPIGLIVLSRIESVEGLLQGHSLKDSRRRITDGPSTQFHRIPTTVLKVSSTSPNFQQKGASSSDNGESEAERLLRLARKLRQQAEEEEQNVHEHLYQKKQKEDEQLDQWIQNLCLNEAKSTGHHVKKNVHIVNQLKDRKPCMETLERIVDRLHEHHLIASGHECVEAPKSSLDQHHHVVQRVHHQKDDAQVQKIELQAEALFEAINIVDEELHHDHRSDHSDASLAESRHWGGDQRAKELRNRWHSLLREHEEQFLKRQKSFIDAQTIKKDNPPPPKVKDDHGLVP